MNELRHPEVALAALQDPRTTGGVLDEIAQVHPSMQRRVAAHVNADEALLRYLMAHGDPVAVRIASRRLKLLEPATPHPSMEAAAETAFYPVPVIMPGKSVVKKRPSALQAVAIGALAIAVGVTGVISVRMYENSLQRYEPPPIGGPEVPGDPAPPPEVPCQLPGDSWLFGLCGTGDDFLTSVAISGAGTVIATGTSNSVDGLFFGFPNLGINGYMAVVEPGGYPWLQQSVGDVQDLKTAPDGTIVAVGTTHTSESGATVAKYDDLGNVMWQNQFSPEGLVLARFDGTVVAKDGSIVAWGYANDPQGKNYQPYFVMTKYTEDGELLWSRSHSEAFIGIGQAEGSTVDADGNIFVVGSVTPLHETDPLDAMVSKFSPSGDLLWSRTFGGSGQDHFSAVTTAPNGNVVAVGSSNSPDGVFGPTGDGFLGILAEVDQNGDLVSFWTHQLELFMEFNDIAPTPDGGYVIAGFTGHDDFDALVLKVRDLASMNATNFLVWQQTFGGTGEDNFNSVAVDANGDIVVIGSTDSTDGSLPLSSGGSDAVIVRLSPDGDLRPR